MPIDQLELTWRAGDRRYSLTLDADGTPHLEPPLVVEPAEDREERSPRRGPARRGKLWTEEDEAYLRAGFNDGITAADLAADLGRSRGAVAARLVRMGLLSEDEANLRYPVQKPGAEP